MVEERNRREKTVAQILVVRIIHPAAVYIAFHNCAELRDLLRRAGIVGTQRSLHPQPQSSLQKNVGGDTKEDKKKNPNMLF